MVVVWKWSRRQHVWALEGLEESSARVQMCVCVCVCVPPALLTCSEVRLGHGSVPGWSMPVGGQGCLRRGGGVQGRGGEWGRQAQHASAVSTRLCTPLPPSLPPFPDTTRTFGSHDEAGCHPRHAAADNRHLRGRHGQPPELRAMRVLRAGWPRAPGTAPPQHVPLHSPRAARHAGQTASPVQTTQQGTATRSA